MANASQPSGSGRSSWDYQFLVKIDGETYSIKEAPAAESAVVKKVDNIADIVETDTTPIDENDLNFYVRLARFSVAGDRELEAPVTRLMPRLVNVILDSNDVVKKMCSSLDHIVSLLVRGFNFLLDGADDVAMHTFKRFRDEMEHIKTRCCEQNDLYEKGTSEITDTLRLLHKVLFERHDEVLEYAGIGLRSLKLYLNKTFHFFESLPYAIKAIMEYENCMDMPMKCQAEERVQFVCLEAYKIQVMLFYAKWVGLEYRCEQLHHQLKMTEEGLPASLTDTLPVHDARMRAASMAESFREMERVKIQRLDCEMD